MPEKTSDPTRTKEMRMKRTVDIFFYLLENEPKTNAEILEYFDKSFSSSNSKKSKQKAITRIIDNLNLINSESLFFNDFFAFETINKRKHTVILKNKLNQKQILLLIKLLISSRALNKTETTAIIESFKNMITDKDKEVVQASIYENLLNEPYISDGSPRLDRLWALEKCIREQKRIQFDYVNHEPHERPLMYHVTMQPLHVLFDNYYLFLVGYARNDGDEDTEAKIQTYRLDWIREQPNKKQLIVLKIRLLKFPKNI